MLILFYFISLIIPYIYCFNNIKDIFNINEMFNVNDMFNSENDLFSSDSNAIFTNNSLLINNKFSNNDVFSDNKITDDNNKDHKFETNDIQNDNKISSDNKIFNDNIIPNNNQIFNQFHENSKECENRIHRNCIHTKFTEEDVENVRIYLQNRFRVTNPVKPVCKRLRVRKDIKCLTEWELSELIDAFQELYRRGIMDRFSLTHAAYWPAVHKFAEGITWHRWHVNEIEKELRKINPRVTMPYWESYTEFANPEKSIFWTYFGRSGHPQQNYCVTDGAFAYQRVKYPKPHCINRQWNRDGTIPAWESPEWITSVTQTAQTWDQYVELIGFTGHFKLHLSIGGFYGDYSTPFATNDPIFYIFHGFPTDLALLKWQLSDDNYLVPQSYSEGMRLDPQTQQIMDADIHKDYLSFYNEVSVKESFQIGFGELCYIHDQFIRPINDIMKNKKRPQPIAIQRLRSALPPMAFSTYFPKFAAENATFFDYFLPDIGNCPVRDKCRVMPIAKPYNSTPNGLRQLERFQFDAGLDLTPLVFEAETAYYRFTNDLRNYKYCSPYV